MAYNLLTTWCRYGPSYGERINDRLGRWYGILAGLVLRARGGLWTVCDEVDLLLPAVSKRTRRGRRRRMVVNGMEGCRDLVDLFSVPVCLIPKDRCLLACLPACLR